METEQGSVAALQSASGANRGRIVAGLFSTHVPRLMILDPQARRAYMGKNVTTFYDALPQLYRERLAGLDFDTFVVIDTHWHSTLEFILNAHERHEGIYTSDEIPWMIHEYAYDYPGDPELAALIAEEAKARGVPAEAAAHRGLPIHYGTLNPMHYYNPGPAKRRVLPVSVLDTAEVEPNLRFGEALAAAVARSGRRVRAGRLGRDVAPLLAAGDDPPARQRRPGRHQRSGAARLRRARHGAGGARATTPRCWRTPRSSARRARRRAASRTISCWPARTAARTGPLAASSSAATRQPSGRVSRSSGSRRRARA